MSVCLLSILFPFLIHSRAWLYVDVVIFSFILGELSDVQSLIDMKVPNYKIVWGHILTWSHGHDYDACNLEFTVAAARFVKANNLGGMMTWSLNSDTYQRNNDEE